MQRLKREDLIWEMLNNKLIYNKFLALPVRWNRKNQIISVLYKDQRFRLSDLEKRYAKIAPKIV